MATGGVVDSFILLPKICGVGGLLRALSSTGGLGFMSEKKKKKKLTRSLLAREFLK